MEIDGVDISKIKKPTSLGRGPTKPRKPAKSLTEVIEKKEAFWKHGKKGDIFLLDALKNIPKDVPLEDCKIWMEETTARDYRGYGAGYTVPRRVCVGRVITEENPKYKEAWAKYEKDLDTYNQKSKEFKVKKEKHDQEMILYQKYKTAVDLRSDELKLVNRIKTLSGKLSKK